MLELSVATFSVRLVQLKFSDTMPWDAYKQHFHHQPKAGSRLSLILSPI